MSLPSEPGGSSIYDDRFYRNRESSVDRSAREAVPLILDLVAPQSVVDVGCGTGTWLHVFHSLGVNDIFGIDGPWCSDVLRVIESEHFAAIDLRLAFTLPRRFDLVLCLEVAEHLATDRATGLVDDLCRLAPVIVFSAAIPGQGGTGHVNEQWPMYWATLFEQRGFLAVDVLRPALWDNASVNAWYAQNMILYVHKDHALRDIGGLSRWSRPPRSLVHPSLFLSHAGTASTAAPGDLLAGATLGQLFRALPGSLIRSVTTRLGLSRRNGHDRPGPGMPRTQGDPE